MIDFFAPSAPDLVSAAGGRAPMPSQRQPAVPGALPAVATTAERTSRPSGRWWYAFDSWLPVPEDEEFVLA